MQTHSCTRMPHNPSAQALSRMVPAYSPCGVLLFTIMEFRAKLQGFYIRCSSAAFRNVTLFRPQQSRHLVGCNIQGQEVLPTAVAVVVVVVVVTVIIITANVI